MRLILRLKSNKAISQKAFLGKYYSAMNGYIYNILSKDSELAPLHEENGFKGFCFGNIYPVKNQLIKENNDYGFVISSPLAKFIEHLFFSIKEGSLINLGEGSFTATGIEARNFVLKNINNIETISIINLVNNEGKPVLFGREPEKYLEQLRINLLKKYNHFRGKSISLDFNLFENINISQIRTKKNSEPYSIPIIFGENNKFNVIGEKLAFKFNNISNEQLAIFQACFDAGFGERNSFGMGFMVVKK